MAAARSISDDIFLLGDLLGDAIRAQAGEEAFAFEEVIRGLAKSARNGDADARREMESALRSTETDELRLLIRAFTSYFQLVNLAEDNERIRRLRWRDVESDPAPRRGSLRAVVGALATGRDDVPGLSAAQMRALLDHAEVRLVLTAHPTESRRRTIIDKLARIFGYLRQIDERTPAPDEMTRTRERIAATVAELWSSDEIRAVSPSVIDEVRAGLVYFGSTLVSVVPQIYRDIEAALAEAYPDERIRVPPFLGFGSWMGGDRRRQPERDAGDDGRGALADARDRAALPGGPPDRAGGAALGLGVDRRTGLPLSTASWRRTGRGSRSLAPSSPRSTGASPTASS